MGNQLEKDEPTKSMKTHNNKEKQAVVIDITKDDEPKPVETTNRSEAKRTTAETVINLDETEVACVQSLLSGLSHEKHDIDQRNQRLVARWEANRKARAEYWEAAIAKLTLGERWLTRYSNLLLGLCPLAFASEEMWQAFTRELLEILRAEGLTGWVALRGSSVTFLSLHPEKGTDIDTRALATVYKQGGVHGLQQHLAPQSSLTHNTHSNATPIRRSTSNSATASTLHFFDCKVHRMGGPELARETLKEYQLFETFSDLDFNIKSPELIKRLKSAGARVSSADVGGNYNQDDTFEQLPGLWSLKADWTEKLQRDISFVSIANEKDVNSYSSHPFTFEI
jgi:hypothetical protein